SIEILFNAINAFTEKCVKGISANIKRCQEYADSTTSIATALNPIIGYSSAAEVSREAYETGKTVMQVVVERGILSEREAKRLLDPVRLTKQKK
ncbi:MAG: aspartate ammonia-lyase, partial [Thermodesulfovibrionia bacterium]|nr:aspartate ammonia-lyase [Thermodesulfovibrionia bacterium]